ncbi:hypothetical protein FQA39_LY05228 [Lamprigera yunnana]|nr:hypothetical protein FQA39_LY05228 [Lamprigera yunnana]
MFRPPVKVNKNQIIMKIAIILVTVSLFSILSATSADLHLHHPQTVEHHVVKHVTHAEGHDNAKKANAHDQHKHVKKSGKNQHHDEEKSRKETKLELKHKVDDAETGGKQSEYHDGDHHQSHKRAGAVAQHGAKYKTASHDKKTQHSKGFREQFHKDEHKKHDSFYSNDKKSGEYHVYGGKNHKYHNNHFTKNGHGKFNTGKSTGHYEKTAKSGEFKKGIQHQSPNNKHTKHVKLSKKNKKAH